MLSRSFTLLRFFRMLLVLGAPLINMPAAASVHATARTVAATTIAGYTAQPSGRSPMDNGLNWALDAVRRM